MKRDDTKLQLAFKKFQWYNPLDLATAWRIGRLIHVEKVFPKHIHNGQSFSSRGRGRKPYGVHFKNIRYSHPKRWIFVTLPTYYQEKVRQIYKECLEMEGLEYDYCGAFFWIGLRIHLENIKKWWCSEIIAKRLWLINYRLTPLELYNIFT